MERSGPRLTPLKRSDAAEHRDVSGMTLSSVILQGVSLSAIDPLRASAQGC